MNNDSLATLMLPINAFLGCQTPDYWVNSAKNQLPTLLIDHAHCEKKAALSAITLIQRYPHLPDLVNKMSRLAREELRHFEQVLSLMKQMKIPFKNIAAARYAKQLREHCRAQEPHRLLDSLIIGAFIEARSCERFYRLLPAIAEPIHGFYRKLIQSEARHFEDYLMLAGQSFTEVEINQRVEDFRQIEAALILDSDPQFRFHSGQPAELIETEIS